MEIAPTLIGLFIITIGALYLFRADLAMQFQIWAQRKIMGAKYIPGKRTYKIVRVVGLLWIVIGLLAIAGVFDIK